MLEFTCPNCLQNLRAPDSSAGVKFICPSCGQGMYVPGSAKKGTQKPAHHNTLPERPTPPTADTSKTLLGEVAPASLPARPPTGELGKTLLGEVAPAGSPSAKDKTILGESVEPPVRAKSDKTLLGELIQSPGNINKTVIGEQLAPATGRTMLGEAVEGLAFAPPGQQITAANPVGFSYSHAIALIGCAFLLMGVFSPLLSAPIVGDVNYIRNGRGDGIIVLVLAGCAAFLALMGWMRGAWLFGLAAIAIITFTFTLIQVRLSESFTLFGERAIETVQLQWGWPLLYIGGILVVAAAVVAEIRRNPSQHTSAVALGAGSILITIVGTACATWLAGDPVIWIKARVAEYQAAQARQAQAEAENAEREKREKARQEEEQRRAAAEKARREKEQEEAEKEAAKQRALRNQTRQTAVVLDNDDPPEATETPTEWVDARTCAVQQGHVRVRVSDLRQVADRVEIHLVLENIGKAEVQFLSWSSAEGDGVPRLLNHVGNPYPLVPPEQRKSAISLAPEKNIADVLSFQGSIQDVDYLHLELPASSFKGYGQLRLLLPKSLIFVKAAPSLGEKAVPKLRDLLKDKKGRIRKAAADALGNIGADAASALPDLAVAVMDKEATVRASVCVAIGKMGPRSKKVFSQLAMALADADETVQQVALEALDKLELGKDDLPVLRMALKNERAAARAYAANALEAIGRDAESAIPDLIEGLKDGDKGVRGAAASALGAIGTNSRKVIPPLVELMQDREPLVRRRTVLALAKLSPLEGTGTALIQALRDDDAAVVQSAKEALSKKGVLRKSDVTALAALLKLENNRLFALAALGDLGLDAYEAVPDIAAALKDPDPKVRQQAALTLGKIGPKASRAAVELGKLLTDKDGKVKTSALQALRQMGTSASPAIGALVRALKDEEIRTDVLRTLPGLGSKVVPYLADELDGTKEFKAKIELINVLAEMGPEAEAAIPVLSRIAGEDMLRGVREAAKKALTQIRKKK